MAPRRGPGRPDREFLGVSPVPANGGDDDSYPHRAPCDDGYHRATIPMANRDAAAVFVCTTLNCPTLAVPTMEFDRSTTAGVFVAIVAFATAALLGAPMMGDRTVLMMVTPSMIVFGLICLVLGVKHGEHRARTG